MGVTGGTFGRRTVGTDKSYIRGREAEAISSLNVQDGPDYCRFSVCSGTAALPDPTYTLLNAANMQIIPDAVDAFTDLGMSITSKPYVTKLDIFIRGDTAWTAGAAIALQDSTGYPYAWIPTSALLPGQSEYSLPFNGFNYWIPISVTGYAASTGVITVGASSLVTTVYALATGPTPFIVIDGTGVGQTGIIKSNTATTITPNVILQTALATAGTTGFNTGQSIIAVPYWSITGSSTATSLAFGTQFGSATPLTASSLIGMNAAIVAGTGAGASAFPSSRAITANTNAAATVGTMLTAGDATSLISLSQEVNNGLLDLCIGSHFAPGVAGKGLQLAIYGAAVSAGSPIGYEVSGFWAP